jgi:undecaprenyl-diphosphatase
VFEAILWGLVQGLTEFLPVSSSGHLVLVPAFLGIEPPDLATSAVLHLGTLIAVLVYYRKDLLWLVLNFRSDIVARRVATLLVLGTIPAVVLGLLFEDTIGQLQESTTAVGAALIVTGAVLFFISRATTGDGDVESAGPRDAVIIGAAQALALVPGISRSGMTISAGFLRGLTREQAARFAFLLSVPVIFGGGLLQALDIAGASGLGAELGVGVIAAAVSGYAAIAGLIRGLTRWGMKPFAYYCVVVGIAAIAIL